MSTEPLLSISLCLEEMYPSVTKDAQPLANLSLNDPDMEMLSLEPQALNLHEKMSRHKKEFTKKWI